MSGAPHDRAWLLSHLPHRGTMNLLDAIVSWDATNVVARAISHHSADNPLRRAGELPCACGIEYAAQAVAAHGALLGGDSAAPTAGMLASARSVLLHVRRLDDLAAALDIHAEQLGGGAAGLLYSFRVSAAGQALLEGRLTIAFDPSAAPAPAR